MIRLERLTSTLLIGATAIAMFAVPAKADEFVGQASVVDGDTIEIHGMRIRLWGIDAPESTQLCRGDDSLQYRCGAEAANATFIANRPVNCSPINRDRYGRTVATCTVGGGDLGERLVRQGLALDWPQYSSGKYGPSNGERRKPVTASGGQLRRAVAIPGLHLVQRQARRLL
jgi:endonuclease YncB( thermonuclease family)